MAQKKKSGGKKSSKKAAATDTSGASVSQEFAVAMPLISEDANIRRDETTGRPRKIRGDFELPESTLAAADSEGGGVAGAVRAFLQANADQTGLRADESTLSLMDEVSTPVRRVVRFQRLHEGIPVLDSSVIVQVDDANRVKQIDLGDTPQIAADQGAATKELTPKQAQQAAMASLGEPAALRMDGGDPEQVYYPSASGLRLAYKVFLPTAAPAMHDWRVIIDAYTGDVLEKRDLIAYIDGSGLVFDPNPVVMSNNNTLRDPDATSGTCGFAGTARATIDTQRVARALRDITLSSGKFKLEGPFVRIRNFAAPVSTLPAEASATNFNYSTADDRFEATNVYYHVDTAQRYIQSLGILNAHNSVIECDPHDNSNDAAWYSPTDKGLHFSDSGPCRPDRGEDGHVMFHEYGHAIQDNQVPGWGSKNPTTNRFETAAMGEGFGDAFACIYFSGHGGGFMREVFEQWVFGDTAIHGLRRVDGTKVYPTSWVNEVHSDGEIWSSALWNVYRSIGGDSANAADRQAARDAVIKSVILSHPLVAANATMPDGAEAVMDTNAALPEYRGKHLIEMLNSFHDRGILRSNAGVDLYIRDAAGDPGADAFTGPVFWDSPDLWIRNADDNGTVHQPPEFGQDNWFYARVRNRGTQPARAFVVTFNAKLWAGTEFVYPADFVPFISAAVGYDLAPGGQQVVKAKWPKALVPPKGSHVCWLSSVYTPVDLVPAGRHVWEHNNLAQKNLIVVDAVAGDVLSLPFQLGTLARTQAETFTLEVRRPTAFPALAISLTHQDAGSLKSIFSTIDPVVRPTSVPTQPVIRFLQPTKVEIAHRAAGADPVRLTLGANSTLDMSDVGIDESVVIAAYSADVVSDADVVTDAGTAAGTLTFKPGAVSAFPLTLQPRTAVSLVLRVAVPKESRPGDSIDFQVVQRNQRNQVVGGITYRINVK